MSFSTAHKHQHDQTVASKTWVVVHNLNSLTPIVDVFIDTGSGLQKILPLDIVVNSAIQITVTHSSARTGKVSVI